MIEYVERFLDEVEAQAINKEVNPYEQLIQELTAPADDGLEYSFLPKKVRFEQDQKEAGDQVDSDLEEVYDAVDD